MSARFIGTCLEVAPGINDAGVIAQFTARFPKAAAVGIKPGDQEILLADCHSLQEPHIEFGGHAKPFHRDRRRPDHDFIQSRRNDAAVNNPAETRMLWSGCEVAVDLAPGDAKTQAQSVRIVSATNEAVFCVRELHGQVIHFETMRPIK